MKTRIGIDINGVLTPATCQVPGRGTDIPTEPYPGCFEQIRKLVEKFGTENVYIISRAPGEDRKIGDQLWLEKHRFYERTGVQRSNVTMYVGRRDHKAAVAREICLTHMIDDRLDVLDPFDRSVMCIAFAVEDDDELLALFSDRNFLRVANWKEVTKYFGV